jgi:hypothetical protein
MEFAGGKGCTAAQVSLARELLAQFAQAGAGPVEGEPARKAAAELATLPGGVASAVLHACGAASRQELLREAAIGRDKALSKEAKRELQRLKQRGVAVAEVGPVGEPVLKPPPEAEPTPCFGSSIDTYGERAVWWTRPYRGGVEVVQAVISDSKGIIAVDRMMLARKQFKQFLMRLPKGSTVSSAEISRDHARALIQQAAEEGSRNGFAPPGSYAEALASLGPAPEVPETSPGTQVEMGPEGELPHAMAGAALFDDPLFAAWIPEEDALRKAALRVEEIALSQLYVDDTQRLQAFDSAVNDHAQAYFTPERRARYSARLYEMAHVLKSDGRVDAARTAAAVARAIATAEGENSPFCRALFAHALSALMRPRPPSGDVPPAPSPASGLVTP